MAPALAGPAYAVRTAVVRAADRLVARVAEPARHAHALGILASAVARAVAHTERGHLAGSALVPGIAVAASVAADAVRRAVVRAELGDLAPQARVARVAVAGTVRARAMAGANGAINTAAVVDVARHTRPPRLACTLAVVAEAIARAAVWARALLGRGAVGAFPSRVAITLAIKALAVAGACIRTQTRWHAVDAAVAGLAEAHAVGAQAVLVAVVWTRDHDGAVEALEARVAQANAVLANPVLRRGAVVRAGRVAKQLGARGAAKAGRAQAVARQADAVRVAHARTRLLLVTVEPDEAWVAVATAVGAHAVARALIRAQQVGGAVLTGPARLTHTRPLAAAPMVGAIRGALKRQLAAETSEGGLAVALAVYAQPAARTLVWASELHGAVGAAKARVAEALAVPAHATMRAHALAQLRHRAVFTAVAEVAEALPVDAQPVRRAVGVALCLDLAAVARKARRARADALMAQPIA